MTVEEAIARFEKRSTVLTRQAWIFLVLVLVLLLSGILAVLFAQNLTANDIGAPSIDEKLAATQREQNRIKTRYDEISKGPLNQCTSKITESLANWKTKPPTVLLRTTINIEGAPSGDVVAQEAANFFSQHPELTGGAVQFAASFPMCSIGTSFWLKQEQLIEFKSALSGKVFLSAADADALKEMPTLTSRANAMEQLISQINLEKIETEIGVLKPSGPSSKNENDLFLRLLQTSVTRFGLLAVIGFFVSILVSLYRYNIRLAAFYLARADVLRLQDTSATVSDFALLAAALTPALEFGKAPQQPLGQIVDLLKTAKEVGK